MEITIKINGRMVSIEVSYEVAECYDQGRRKAENLYHEKRRHWGDREFDEYIVATESGLNNRVRWGGQHFKWWLEEQPGYTLYIRYPGISTLQYKWSALHKRGAPTAWRC